MFWWAPQSDRTFKDRQPQFVCFPPVLFAGGCFKHGQHLAFDTTENDNIATLYVSMLQRLVIECDPLAGAKSTLRGLELV